MADGPRQAFGFEGSLGISKAAALLVMAASLILVCGWLFDVEGLKTLSPGLPNVKANASVMFLFAALALWLSYPGAAAPSLRRSIVLILSGAMFVTGLLTLAEYASGRDLGIDQLLFRDSRLAEHTSSPGRMSPVTALNFLLFGLAFLWIDRVDKHGRRRSNLLALIVAATSGLAVLGYLYGVDALYRIAQMTSMALPTALLFLLASVGLALCRPESAFARQIFSDTAAGEVNRRLLPAALLIPPAIGWLRWQGELAGWYSTAFGLALFAGSNVTVFSLLVWWSSRALQHSHERRIEAVKVSDWQQAMIDSADFTVISTDSDGLIRTFNAGAANLLGHRAEDLIGVRTPQIIHLEREVIARAAELSAELGVVVEPGFEVFVAKARRGLADENDWTYVRKDGSHFAVRLSVTALHDERGILTGFLGIGKDVSELRRAEAALRDSEQRLRMVTDNIPAMVSYIDRDERYQFANPGVGSMFGMDSAQIIGRTMREVRGDALYEIVSEHVSRALRGERVSFEGVVSTGSRDMHYRSVLVPDFGARAEVRGMYAMTFDVTDLKNSERLLFEEKERAQVMLSSIGDAVIACDTELRVTFLNPIATDMTGWSAPDATGRHIDEVLRLIDLGTGAERLSPLAMAVSENRVVALQFNTAIERRDGVRSPIEDSAAPIHDREGQVVGGVMVFHDVSESRAMALKMSHQAQHDSLTDLPNRILFQDRLSQALAKVPQGQAGAVMFIDLDHFKIINDSLGHPAGDLVLQEVARRLVAAVRNDDTVSRQGGDEFMVLLMRLFDPRDAARVAEKLFEAMRVPIEVEGRQLYVNISIGIALFPQDASEGHLLTRHSDTALYHAKQSGRNRYSYFESGMSQKAENRLLLEQELRQGLTDGELFLVYQAKVARPDGRMTGMEALVRWRRSDGSIVAPDQFIPVAEECGLVAEVDRWVMLEACQQNRAWQDAGMPCLPVSVNVSLARLDSDELLSSVRNVLAKTGLPPASLEIEFTESQMFSNLDRASELIEGLRDLQVRVAIDDFGTGYSNFSYLVQHRFNTLKIDRTFVNNLPHDVKQLAVVQAIAAMATALEATVVAEGVETLAQAECLEQNGCRELQGYLYSRPVEAPAFGLLLAQRTLQPAHPPAKAVTVGS